MGEHVRARTTFANVVSLIALFIAIGGTTYAATQLSKNSVKSKHIAKGQVKSSDAKNDGITGTDVLESSLGSVPEAAHAAAADNALHAGDVDGMSGNDFYRTSTATAGAPLEDIATLGSLTFRLKCLDNAGTTATQLWVRSTRAGLTGMTKLLTDNEVVVVSTIDALAADTDQVLGAANANSATPVFTSVDFNGAVPPVSIGNFENTAATFFLKAKAAATGPDCTVSGVGLTG